METLIINICLFVRIWFSVSLIIGSIIQWTPKFVRFICFEIYGDENVGFRIPTSVKLNPVMPPKKWDRWLSANKDRLYWNEKEKIYKVKK